MSVAVGVIIDDELEWHMGSVMPTDHITACGLDGGDCGQELGPDPAPGQKITCSICWSIYRDIRSMRVTKKDFSKKLWLRND
jgi:hypothetical protein